MVTNIFKWHWFTLFLFLFITSVSYSVIATPFPPAGVDNTGSLGKFTLRLSQAAGQAWLGIPNCPWNPNCLIHSPVLADSQTLIGRSNPHKDGDTTDEVKGAKICQTGNSISCSTYLPQTVKDSDFMQVPPTDGTPFDEGGPQGTKEIHTQILALKMIDQGKCGTQTANVVRAGLSINLPPSIGEVESLNQSSTSDFPAESFFNMFVEVDIDLTALGLGVKTLFNKKPLVIQNGQLNSFPPHVVYIHGVSHTTPEVYDKLTGQLIGWIELAGHDIGVEECDKQELTAFEKTYDQLIEENQSLSEKGCYGVLPQPDLQVLEGEDYEANNQQWTRYRLAITNYDLLPKELFQVANHLPPCGLNVNSSRTWVDIYRSGGTRLYGFCALNSPSQLKDHLWFAVPKGEIAPKCVHVELNDRQCNIRYRSNSVCDYTPGTIQFSQSQYQVTEKQSKVTLWVERNGGSRGNIKVKYGTTSLTAQTGIDYQPVGGELMWANGEMTSKAIDVPIINDKKRESSEHFYVTLLDSFGESISPKPLFDKPIHAKVTIHDDDFTITPPPFKPLIIFNRPQIKFSPFTPIKIIFSSRLFTRIFIKSAPNRDDTLLEWFDDQEYAFMNTLQDSLHDLNLPELGFETDGNNTRLEIPVFDLDDPEIPQAWYSVSVGNPVEIKSKKVPVTGLIPPTQSEIAYLVFQGDDDKYYQSPLYPALDPKIMEALTDAFPNATLTQSQEGVVTFTRDNEATQFRLSYLVTPAGFDMQPLTVKPIDTDGDQQVDSFALSAYGRDQQVQLIK